MAGKHSPCLTCLSKNIYPMKYLSKLFTLLFILFAGFAVAACGDDDEGTGGGHENGGGNGGGDNGDGDNSGDNGGGDNGGGSTFNFADPYLGFGADVATVKASVTGKELLAENSSYLVYEGKSPVELEAYFFELGKYSFSQLYFSSDGSTLDDVNGVIGSRYSYQGTTEEGDYLYLNEDETIGVFVWEETDDETQETIVLVQYQYLGEFEGGDSDLTFNEPYIKWNASVDDVIAEKGGPMADQAGTDGLYMMAYVGEGPVQMEVYGFWNYMLHLSEINFVEGVALEDVCNWYNNHYNFLGFEEDESGETTGMYVFADEDYATGVQLAYFKEYNQVIVDYLDIAYFTSQSISKLPAQRGKVSLKGQVRANFFKNLQTLKPSKIRGQKPIVKRHVSLPKAGF